MRCTSVEKNKCNARINQELTSYQIWIVLHLLHVHMVHGCLLVRVWLGATINLVLRAVIGIMSQFPALVALNQADIFLSIVIAIAIMTVSSRVVSKSSAMIVSSITITALAIPSIVLMSITPAEVMAIASIPVVSRVMAIAIMEGASPLWRPLVVTIMVVLSLAVLHALVFRLHNNGPIQQLLIAVEPYGYKLDGYFIIEPSHELILPLSISSHIIRSVTSQLVEEITILAHSACSLA
jgi:hypothetical protein